VIAHREVDGMTPHPQTRQPRADRVIPETCPSGEDRSAALAYRPTDH
jgi:hypothetical protein